MIKISINSGKEGLIENSSLIADTPVTVATHPVWDSHS